MLGFNLTTINGVVEFNLERCSSTGQVLSLFFRGYQFEFYKFQGHWRLIWSLTSGLVGREINRGIYKLTRDTMLIFKKNCTLIHGIS